MSFIPADAEWYLADIVEQISVEDDPRSAVHINTVLIRASSPEEVYRKALECGKQGETSYENPDGKAVRITFRGLRNLNMIYEPLEDGAEISFDEKIGLDEEAIRAMVRPREELGVFAPIVPSPGPNYRSADVESELAERFGISIEG